jgi:acyl-CoA thioesterase-1
MSSKNYSRRKFLGLASLLPVFSAGVCKAGESKFLGNSFKGLSDLESIKELIKQKEAVKWVFAGDSITMGVEHTHGYQSFPEIFEERIRWEMRRMRDIVINTGVSGNTTQNIIDDFDWRISQFKPAVVSLMIGTNDCGGYELGVFEKNLDLLIIKIRELNAIPILQTPNIVIPELSVSRKRLPEFVSVIQKVAERQKTVLIDNWGYWSITLRDHPETGVYKNWLNDPIHPNQTGHQEIARLMFKELSIFDPIAASCGGKYYEGKH